MKIEAKLFEILTVFFILVAIVYGVFTAMSRTGIEWAGLTAIILSAGLSLIVGTYFRFVARRLDTRPEDYEEAEISDGSGDLGFFSPGSFWPILLAGAAAFAAISLAFFQPWMIVVAVVLVLTRRRRPGLRVPPRTREALALTSERRRRRRTPAGFGAFAVLGARHRVAAASGTQFPWKPAGTRRGGSAIDA